MLAEPLRFTDLTHDELHFLVDEKCRPGDMVELRDEVHLVIRCEGIDFEAILVSNLPPYLRYPVTCRMIHQQSVH